MSLPELGEKLKAIKKLQADKQIYLRADQDVRYGLVMKTIAEIKQAGIEKLGMVTRPVSPNKDNRQWQKRLLPQLSAWGKIFFGREIGRSIAQMAVIFPNLTRDICGGVVYCVFVALEHLLRKFPSTSSILSAAKKSAG